MPKKISPQAFIPMDLFTDDFSLQIDLVYARDCDLNIFGPVYHQNARLWLHEDLAKIILLAALHLKKQGYQAVLYDGLRTSEAQEKMMHTDIVKANPHWLESPRLLSPPGAGAHPRGMAVDLTLMDEKDVLLDMGTVFDHLADNQSPKKNPAHREYPYLSEHQKKNRNILDQAMVKSAETLGIALLPLPQEWWDFRLPPEIYDQYNPLSDADLPLEMRMVNGAQEASGQNEDSKKQDIIKALTSYLIA